MTQAQLKFATFADYLAYEDDTDQRYELIDGVLVELPPESRLNVALANHLFLLFVNAGVPFQLIYPHTCELQVPVMRRGDPLNRYPDLVVLRPEHLQYTERRLTITLEMPPPQLVVEVVSPGSTNRERDYQHKFAQYEAREIDEYWIIDRDGQSVTVFSWQAGHYVKLGQFNNGDSYAPRVRILSKVLPNLALTPSTLFSFSQSGN